MHDLSGNERRPVELTPETQIVQTHKIGNLTVHTIEAGGLKLDGGAMFGVIPKMLWDKRIPADDRNRIPLAMRCLLIEHEAGLILIDTGMGNKENEKLRDIYGVENSGANNRTALEDGLAQLGVTPDKVDIVINTHLHFDHAGGNTYLDSKGELKPTFPNAKYVVQLGEYDYATHTNERTAGSYFDRNYTPLEAAGQFDFIKGEKEIVSGIRAVPTPGHTPFHQSILIESAGERAFYLADLAPTHAHIPLVWIMGYDVEPLVTLETKRRIFQQAHHEHWTLIFEHDSTNAWGRLEKDDKGYRLA